jgi:hypothetical protein
LQLQGFEHIVTHNNASGPEVQQNILRTTTHGVESA